MQGTTNWKFHLIAITVTLLVCVGLFREFAPEDNAATQQAQGFTDFIQISRASYGLNCNAMLDRMRKRAAREPQRFSGTKIDSNASVNNVLRYVSSQCDGELTCKLYANNQTVGVGQIRSCNMDLEIDYRCQTMDAPTKVIIENERAGILSCEADTRRQIEEEQAATRKARAQRDDF